MKIKEDGLTPLAIEKALISPTSIFDRPAEVIACEHLSRDQKLQILKRWETDAQSLERATDENMSGGEQPPIDEISNAISKLEENK